MFDFLSYLSIYLIFGEIVILIFCHFGKHGNKVAELLSIALVFKILVSYGYYAYSLQTSADATSYYLYATQNHFAWRNLLEPSTPFICNVAALFYPFTTLFSNRYLMLFIPFSLCAFIGSIVFYNVLEVFYTKHTRKTELYLLAFYLPDLLFWTSNIGKDSIIYLGLMLILYGVMNGIFTIKAIICIISGGLITYFVRPHMVLFLIAGFSFGMLLERYRFSWRTIGIFLIMVGAFFMSYDNIFKFIGIKLENETETTKIIENYYEEGVKQLDYRAEQLSTAGSSTGNRKFNIVYSPLYLFEFLCSPFIWQVRKPIQIFSAVSSIVYQFMIIYLLLNWRTFQKETKVPYKYCFLMYIVIAGVLLGMAQTNFGLAVRQKCMLLPFLILLFASARSVKRLRLLPEVRHRSALIIEPVVHEK